MEFWIGVLFAIGIFVALIVRSGKPSPEEARAAARQNRPAKSRYQVEQEAKAAREAKIVCPHCQERGHVTTHMQQRKGGVSGGKATAGLLTGGVSLLAVGLAKKGWTTQLRCSNCGMNWEVQP